MNELQNKKKEKENLKIYSGINAKEFERELLKRNFCETSGERKREKERERTIHRKAGTHYPTCNKAYAPVLKKEILRDQHLHGSAE